MNLTVGAIRAALDGGVPALVATASPEGEPNVSYLSDVQYVDDRHIALSYQFFNKTRRNVLANPFARLHLIDPLTGRQFRVLAQYLRTETDGPLFEQMRARLAGIASHSGMADVFRLRGADLYRVLAIDPVDGTFRAHAPAPDVLAPLRRTMSAVLRARDLDELFDGVLDAVVREFPIGHVLLMVRDVSAGRLYTVASRGYATAGVGAELADGEGIIGVAAACGTPIRVNHALSGHAYAHAVRERWHADESDAAFDDHIPFPGLPNPGSQMAVPIGDGDRVIGILYVEDEAAERFGYDLEDALATVADALGLAMRQLEMRAAGARAGPGHGPPAAPASDASAGSRGALQVRHDARTDSVFIDDEYVIRGVAGAVLWKMLAEFATAGRVEFSSRALRADPALRLPEIADNLAARLILLQRRLDERRCGVRLRKTGRGRVALEFDGPSAVRLASDR